MSDPHNAEHAPLIGGEGLNAAADRRTQMERIAAAERLQSALARLGHPIPDGVALRVAEEMGDT